MYQAAQMKVDIIVEEAKRGLPSCNRLVHCAQVRDCDGLHGSVNHIACRQHAGKQRG